MLDGLGKQRSSGGSLLSIFSDLSSVKGIKGNTHGKYTGLPLWLGWCRIHLQCRRPGFDPWVGKIPWRRERVPTPVFWPGEFHGLYSLWGHKESDTTERLSLFTHGKESREQWALHSHQLETLG